MTSTSERKGTVPPPDIDGVVREDSVTRQLYSTDASIYEVKPEYVLFPVNRSDIQTIHRWSATYDVTLVPRGAGTSLSGQSIGRGAVVDYSKHFDGILNWDARTKTVRVEPGVVLEQLNEFLEPRGRSFGPDVATSNRATIGGMIGNNSAGAHSIRYGYTARHVESITCVLPGGEEVQFEPLNREEARRKARGDGPEARLYRTVPRLVEDRAGMIDDQYPELLRNVSGYGLDRFLDRLEDDVVDFTELICGSEGTLGAVVEATLKTVPAIETKGLLVVNCSSLQDAVRANRRIIEESPLAVELLDRTLLELAGDSRELSRYMDWMQGNPEAVLIVEVGSEVGRDDMQKRVDTIRDAVSELELDLSVTTVLDEKTQQNVWKVRKSGLPLLLGISDDRKPTTFVEDTAVDPEHLADYVREFQSIVEDFGTTAAFYGHISVGCLHIRPLINLKSAGGIRDMKAMTEAVVELVKKYNGSLSGEHGDGRARSEWLDEFYSPEMTELFEEVKTAFDPDHRFNPGNIVEPGSMTEDLRYGEDYRVEHWDLEQDFSGQGGFAEIIERCNGSAVCRKEESGTMCPSYMVTRDEKHSTRGRANVLRGLISGSLDREALTDGRLEEVMDLCISCKACKSECPSEVDMAPLKQEISHRLHRENGANLREWFFGAFGRFARLAAPAQPLVGWLQSVPGVEPLMKWVLGVAPERSLPALSGNPVQPRTPVDNPEELSNPVVLYTDTFNGYLEPEVLRQTWNLFEALGADPIVPEVPCCGRTYLSQGFLGKGRRQARKTVEVLADYAGSNIPIVTLEPSCYSAIVDDYPRLVPGEKTDRVAGQTELLTDFLEREYREELENQAAEVEPAGTVRVHGHCHQKALLGEESLVSLLEAVAGDRVEFIDSGCCGMAGSFGYEREHYDHSTAMGERKLMPAVRNGDGEDRIVAPGLSCRDQIRDLTGLSPDHPAEFLNDLVRPGRAG